MSGFGTSNLQAQSKRSVRFSLPSDQKAEALDRQIHILPENGKDARMSVPRGSAHEVITDTTNPPTTSQYPPITGVSFCRPPQKGILHYEGGRSLFRKRWRNDPPARFCMSSRQLGNQPETAVQSAPPKWLPLISIWTSDE